MQKKAEFWWEGTVALDKTQEDGSTKKVKEKYLFDASSFTDAEALLLDYVSQYVSGEVEISDLKKRKYVEVFESDHTGDDYWFAVKCEIIVLDEKTDEEKRTALLYLQQGATAKGALSAFEKNINSEVFVNYEIIKVEKTSILDVFESNLKK